MSVSEEKLRVTIASACMTTSGTPDFTLTEVEVTQDEYENGVQYDLVVERLITNGFEEPFVHFEEIESPHFLVPAVRLYLAQHDNNHPLNNLVALEKA